MIQAEHLLTTLKLCLDHNSLAELEKIDHFCCNRGGEIIVVLPSELCALGLSSRARFKLASPSSQVRALIHINA
jgi:hypothetical protein